MGAIEDALEELNNRQDPYFSPFGPSRVVQDARAELAELRRRSAEADALDSEIRKRCRDHEKTDMELAAERARADAATAELDWIASVARAQPGELGTAIPADEPIGETASLAVTAIHRLREEVATAEKTASWFNQETIRALGDAYDPECNAVPFQQVKILREAKDAAEARADALQARLNAAEAERLRYQQERDHYRERVLSNLATSGPALLTARADDLQHRIECLGTSATAVTEALEARVAELEADKRLETEAIEIARKTPMSIAMATSGLRELVEAIRLRDQRAATAGPALLTEEEATKIYSAAIKVVGQDVHSMALRRMRAAMAVSRATLARAIARLREVPADELHDVAFEARRAKLSEDIYAPMVEAVRSRLIAALTDGAEDGGQK